jgi:hypothetical protein
LPRMCSLIFNKLVNVIGLKLHKLWGLLHTGNRMLHVHVPASLFRAY